MHKHHPFHLGLFGFFFFVLISLGYAASDDEMLGYQEHFLYRHIDSSDESDAETKAQIRRDRQHARRRRRRRQRPRQQPQVIIFDLNDIDLYSDGGTSPPPQPPERSSPQPQRTVEDDVELALQAMLQDQTPNVQAAYHHVCQHGHIPEDFDINEMPTWLQSHLGINASGNTERTP